MLLDLEGPCKARVLPGHNLFQSCHISENADLMRPAVFHAYEAAKRTAGAKLAHLATQGWETLLPVMVGTPLRTPVWTHALWFPVGGLSLHPRKAPSAALEDL